MDNCTEIDNSNLVYSEAKRKLAAKKAVTAKEDAKEAARIAGAQKRKVCTFF